MALEIDRATENATRIEQKFLGYPHWIQQTGLDALTIAFLVTEGDTKRVTALMELARKSLGESELASVFLFAAVPAENISHHLFLDPVFVDLDHSHHALIEQPF